VPQVKTAVITRLTGIRLANMGTTIPIAWATGDLIDVYNVRIKNAQWAGSGTVGLVQNYEEYASNSDVSTTAVVTGSGFLQGFGNFGGFGSGWATGTDWKRRVRFSQPIQWGRDTITVGLREVSTNNTWDQAEKTAMVYSLQRQASISYGYTISPVSGDLYSADISFLAGGRIATNNTYGTSGAGWSDLATNCRWFVKKTSAGKPGEIPSAPTVTVSGQAGNTAINEAPIWTTKLEDSHNAFNKDTSVFTAPIPGNYLFTGSLYTAHGSAAVNWRFQKDVGGGFVEFTPTRHATDASSLITASVYMPVSARFKLNAGDKIRIVRGGTGNSASPTQWLEITWLGK
jgi:hypothetical protein